MKKIVALFFPFLLYANMLQVGDEITQVTLHSQHNQEYKLIKDGMWIISWDKESTSVANRYFEKFHMPKGVNFLVDASQVPSGILNLFVLPKMQKCKHPILMSYDEAFNLTLAYKEDCLTVLYLKNRKITQIKYPQTQEDLKKILK